MTPRQLARHYKGVSGRSRVQLAHDLTVAWYGAAFERSKTMPQLRSVLARLEGRDSRQMPWQEMQANLRGWIAKAKASAKGAKNDGKRSRSRRAQSDARD